MVGKKFELQTFKVEGPILLRPRVNIDHRGFFMESYNKRDFVDVGITTDFVQDNHSKSIKNTLRGLHYQVNRVQAKLLRCTQGEIFDVAVDIRPDSPTFGQWIGVRLSSESKALFFVPGNFAHGFLVLSETAEVEYKCSDFYSPADERSLIWNDPHVAIDWPLSGEPILSPRDQSNPDFQHLRLD